MELKLITGAIKKILMQSMKAGSRFKIIRWSKPFVDRGEEIIKLHNELIIKYGTEPDIYGVVSVDPSKIEEFAKECTEFYNTAPETIEYELLPVDVIEDFVTDDISVLEPLIKFK